MSNMKYIGYDNMTDSMTFISVKPLRKGKDQKEISDSFRVFKFLYC